MDINDFVEKYAPMNPETEFLIPGGHLLQNGMEILVANPDSRHNMTVVPAYGTWQYDRALERNRWSRISHIKYVPEHKLYRFVSTYSDGTQRLRSSEAHQPWFVKFSSVDILQQTRNAVLELVTEAMVKQDRATYHGEGCSSEIADINARIADDILRIFGMGVQK